MDRDIKLFTLPNYKYEKRDEAVQQFKADVTDAARPAKQDSALQVPVASRKPKQLCISTFFQAKGWQRVQHVGLHFGLFVCVVCPLCFGGGCMPQEWFALFGCTLVLQQWFALFGYFVVVGGFGLFGVGVYPIKSVVGRRGRGALTGQTSASSPIASLASPQHQCWTRHSW